jgi:hypothetical protein
LSQFPQQTYDAWPAIYLDFRGLKAHTKIRRGINASRRSRQLKAKLALFTPPSKARRRVHMLTSTLSKDAPFEDIVYEIALALSHAITGTAVSLTHATFKTSATPAKAL